MHSVAPANRDEDVLGDAVVFTGVAKYPARIKCALLGWMAWKDATAQALGAAAAEQALADRTPSEKGADMTQANDAELDIGRHRRRSRGSA